MAIKFINISIENTYENTKLRYLNEGHFIKISIIKFKKSLIDTGNINNKKQHIILQKQTNINKIKFGYSKKIQ